MVMTTDMLSQARSERQLQEDQERQARIEEIRQRVVPYLLLDIDNKLSPADAKTLIEILDDLGLTDDEYRKMRDAAVDISKDIGQLNLRRPMVESEKIRMAKFAVARIRSERAFDRANGALRQATHLRQQIAGYELALQEREYQHPYFFQDGEPMPAVVKIAPKIEAKTEPKKKGCQICLHEFAGEGDYCCGRCANIARDHYDILLDLGILKESK